MTQPPFWGEYVMLLLPFFLIFTIAKGFLDKAQLFGESRVTRRVNLILSFSLAMIGAFLLADKNAFWWFSQGISVVAIGGILLLVLAGLATGKAGGKLPKVLFLIIAGVAVLFAGMRLRIIDQQFISPQVLVVVLAAFAFLLIIRFLLSDTTEEKPLEEQKKGPKKSR